MTERTRYHLSRFDGIAIAWMTLVAAFAIWQTAAFEGVIHRLGDWQFAHVARYFPTATALLVIAVLLLPGLALVWWARRHEKRDLSPRELLDLRSRRLLRTLKTFAIALAVGAAGLLLATLFLPRESGRQPSVVTAAETRPPSGPVMLVGRLKLDRVMLYRQRMGFASRAYYFAPVEPVGDKQLRYFVELPGDIRNGDPGRYRGVISRDMPRPASALYEASGYTIADPAYALYRDTGALRWPYYALAAQLALLALLLLLASFLCRRSMRRTERQMAEATA